MSVLAFRCDCLQRPRDPAEDVGRFLGSLWDWVVQQNFTESEGYKKIRNLQDQFIESYLQKIKGTNTIKEKHQKDFEKIFYN